MEISVANSLKLGDLLVNKGLVTPEQLDEALKELENTPFEKLGETLVRMDIVSEEQVLTTLAEQFGIPYLKID